jgi:hypothetical protein
VVELLEPGIAALQCLLTERIPDCPGGGATPEGNTVSTQYSDALHVVLPHGMRAWGARTVGSADDDDALGSGESDRDVVGSAGCVVSDAEDRGAASLAIVVGPEVSGACGAGAVLSPERSTHATNNVIRQRAEIRILSKSYRTRIRD